MQGNHFAIPIVVPGTLTADVHFEFHAPINCQLEKVSANCDAATSFILDIGENDTPDTDAYLDGVTVTGHATDNTEYTRTDFVGDQFPHIAAGADVVVTIDYDGGAGNDAAGVSILLWFSEG
jgi:hypothetical protein